MELTPEEKALAARIGFDEDVVAVVKREANAFASMFKVDATDQLTYYSGYRHGRLTKREQEPLEGFSVQLPLDVGPLTLLLRGALQRRGYLPFVFQRFYPVLRCPEPGCMVVMKTIDQFDIIRVAYPEGNNDHIENATIVRQLQAWDQRYGLEVIGANGDWLKVSFLTAPADVAEVGAEAVALCPDLQANYWELAEEQARKYYPFQDDEEGIQKQIGYVVGRDIASSRHLFLWWD